MGELISITTMTVDGVTDVGEWYVSEGGHDQAARDQFHEGAEMLFGRKTYEGLAQYWSPLTGEWADVLNPMPKHVASRTLEGSLDWNATVIAGDVSDGVAKLKAELEGDLLLIGCGELARHLAADELIDEYRFWLHPAVWGQGARLLEGDEQLRLELVETRSFDSGVVLLRYRRAGVL